MMKAAFLNGSNFNREKCCGNNYKSGQNYFHMILIIVLVLPVADTISVCRSYIPFSFDVSTNLTPAQFKTMKSFLLNPFLNTLFPADIQPAPFSTYSEQNHGYRRPANVSDIVSFVINAPQGNSSYSFITRPLKYFVDQNVTNLATTKLTVNIVVFAGNSLANSDIPVVQNYTSVLKAYGSTVTVVLMNPYIDSTNYRQISGLNVIVWSDSVTTINDIKYAINCEPSPSTSTLPTIATTSDIPAHVCRSYIPFSFDICQKLNSSQFENLKSFLVNPFLESVFPTDVQPAWYSTYDSVNHVNNTRPGNVSAVISDVQNTIQHGILTSDFNLPLGYFANHVPSLGSTDGLPANTIIFAGAALTNVNLAISYAYNLTSNGNTLTVVLMNPNIDQTGYRNISGLNIVVWSDPATTISAIKNVMNCEPSAPVSTLPTITTTAPLPASVCRSYIPFSFDVSAKLTSDEFRSLKNFLLNPFLDAVFPFDIQPAPFSTYAEVDYGTRRQANVTDIISYVTVDAIQKTIPDSYITAPLAYFVSRNVVSLGLADGLPVNTVIFVGDQLFDFDVSDVQNFAYNLTANGNTLTVVLVNPNIDQTNYKNISGLNIVIWSDTTTLISQIEGFMNCLGRSPPTNYRRLLV